MLAKPQRIPAPIGHANEPPRNSPFPQGPPKPSPKRELLHSTPQHSTAALRDLAQPPLPIHAPRGFPCRPPRVAAHPLRREPHHTAGAALPAPEPRLAQQVWQTRANHRPRVRPRRVPALPPGRPRRLPVHPQRRRRLRPLLKDHAGRRHGPGVPALQTHVLRGRLLRQVRGPGPGPGSPSATQSAQAARALLPCSAGRCSWSRSSTTRTPST